MQQIDLAESHDSEKFRRALERDLWQDVRHATARRQRNRRDLAEKRDHRTERRYGIRVLFDD
jgi:hypothetical protein